MSGKQSLHVMFLAATLAAMACVAVVQKAAAQDDKYAGAFLEIPVGAHALSMGGAFSAIANDESAFHWNPAGVSLLDHKYFGFMYSSEFGLPGSALANFFHLGMTYPMANTSVALNWVRLGVGDMSHTPDLTGINITSEREQQVFNSFNGNQDIFSDVQDAVVLSVARNNKFVVDWGWLYYSHPIELPIGVNFKYIHQSIGTFGTAQGIGVDAGIMLRFSLADYLLIPVLGKVSIGTNFTDIGGTKLTWSTQHQQTIPMRILAGTAYTQELSFINSVATLACDFAVHEAGKPHLGLDVTYGENISVRMGLDQGDFAAGAGFVWQKKLKLDYSLSLHDLGPEHRLSFGVDIDNILNPPSDSTEVVK